MILCITEKPSVAADIARLLGASARREGFFEGGGYWVTWTYGHLCTLKEPADYSPYWKSWSLSFLPMIPPRFGIKIIPQPSIERQFRVIEALIAKADEIINCGDAGQEGELIQRWVMQKAGCRIPVRRLWISSLTDEAIREGFNNLRPETDLKPLYEAGLCRAIGDWILGINATRLYTLKYAQNRQILSVGRVQTPTLALLVKRQDEIDHFVPKDYWELKTVYRNVTFSAQGKNFDSEDKAMAMVEKLKPLPFEVTDFSKKKGSEAPPRLYDLTSLQVDCNKKLGIGVDDSLKIIQSLYEKKVSTYPRVDTTYLTDDIYPKCGPTLLGLTQYAHLVEPLKGRPLRKTKKVFDNSKVTDHHAIIPTGQPLPSNLSELERRVFDLIARRFISVFYPDCTFEQTTVLGQVDKTKFKATGRIILDQGWKAVYAKEAKEAADDDDTSNADARNEEAQEMPVFTKGESGPHEPKLNKKTTQPPKLYTEGTLLKAMETAGSQVEDEDLREALKANGIGRPSTRAAIIETLYKRGYIEKVRKSIKATEAGIALINLIKVDLLKSAELTGIWENRLRMIERQEYAPAEFLNQLKQMISQITVQVLADNSRVTIEATQPQATPPKKN
ncbi:MAG: DNA topoisomerase 3 [Muribaculaceae bacterium]|nr:DNA topoisomerase 3 [Muribaculaceae bacterium]